MSYDSLPPQKYTDEEPILRRTALQAEVWLRVIYPRALPPATHGSALQAPERLWGTGDVITLQAPECLRGTGGISV